MKKVLANFLLGTGVTGLLMALILLFYIVGDIIVTELGARLLASAGIAVGKFALGLGVILLVIGVMVNFLVWLLSGDDNKGKQKES